MAAGSQPSSKLPNRERARLTSQEAGNPRHLLAFRSYRLKQAKEHQQDHARPGTEENAQAKHFVLELDAQ